MANVEEKVQRSIVLNPSTDGRSISFEINQVKHAIHPSNPMKFQESDGFLNRLCGSIWPRCTMSGIFVDIHFLKATILNY